MERPKQTKPETSPSRLPRFGQSRLASTGPGLAAKGRSLLPQRSPVRAPAKDAQDAELAGAKDGEVITESVEAGRPDGEPGDEVKMGAAQGKLEPATPSAMKPPLSRSSRSLRKPSTADASAGTTRKEGGRPEGNRPEGHRVTRSQDVSSRQIQPPSSTSGTPSASSTAGRATSHLQRSSSTRGAVEGKKTHDTQDAGPARRIQPTRHARTSSLNVVPQSPRAGESRAVKSTLSSTTSRLAPPTESAKKPTFSTLQQHFSPKKSTRPAATSSSLSPHKASGSLAPATIETIRLQTELLQLDILYQSAGPTLTQWRASARSTIQQRFETLAHRHRDLLAAEQEAQERVNGESLREWLSVDHGVGDGADRIQTLSSTLQEIQLLLVEPGSGGKYPRVLKTFEKWLARIEDVYRRREHPHAEDEDEEDEVIFVEGLGVGWRNEAASLSRKISSLSRQLERTGLGTATPGSGLEMALSRSRDILSNATAELEMMTSLERDVLTKERVWIDTQIAQILDGEGRDESLEDMIKSHRERKGAWLSS
ncbi:MAG: hypothetical protein M4579_007471 [Chaenotheca gracillima]|nr:MAG: hypothetical protein M4579_007471 [Chaenotheca gracillima]